MNVELEGRWEGLDGYAMSAAKALFRLCIYHRRASLASDVRKWALPSSSPKSDPREHPRLPGFFAFPRK